MGRGREALGNSQRTSASTRPQLKSRDIRCDLVDSHGCWAFAVDCSKSIAEHGVSTAFSPSIAACLGRSLLLSFSSALRCARVVTRHFRATFHARLLIWI